MYLLTNSGLLTVLHLGNVYFHRKQLKHGQEGVEIGSDAEIRWTGHLLRLDPDGIKQALTTKTTVRRIPTTLSIEKLNYESPTIYATIRF